jgi:hypothetical protein
MWSFFIGFDHIKNFPNLILKNSVVTQMLPTTAFITIFITKFNNLGIECEQNQFHFISELFGIKILFRILLAFPRYLK